MYLYLIGSRKTFPDATCLEDIVGIIYVPVCCTYLYLLYCISKKSIVFFTLYPVFDCFHASFFFVVPQHVLLTSSFSSTILQYYFFHWQQTKLKMPKQNSVDLDIAACVFLSVLSSFLPPWGDYILSMIIFAWNLRVAMKLNFEIPAW